MRLTIRTLLYILWQCTWGFAQTLCGGLVLLRNLRRKHGFYHGAVVTEWSSSYSMSLGMFLFVSDRLDGPRRRHILMHEYGHSIQSMILGPLYLPVIGLPSILWCRLPVFRRMRAEGRYEYDDFYPEKWANACGCRVLPTLDGNRGESAN